MKTSRLISSIPSLMFGLICALVLVSRLVPWNGLRSRDEV